jgi:hypothetical protein
MSALSIGIEEMAESGESPKTIGEIMEASWNETVGQDTDDLPYENALDPEASSGQDSDSRQSESQDEGTPSQEPAQLDQSQKDEPSKDTPGTREEPVEIPAHWPEADRQMFGRLDKEAQTWLLNRHRQMEANPFLIRTLGALATAYDTRAEPNDHALATVARQEMTGLAQRCQPTGSQLCT